MTCKDCIHFDACKSLLEAQGYIVDGDGHEADKRCDQFAARSKYIEMPCKIGDTAWVLRKFRHERIIKKGEISEIYFTPSMKLQVAVHGLGRGRIGKVVFLSKEEAEKALKAAPENPARDE